jgi:hypothetical protein
LGGGVALVGLPFEKGETGHGIARCPGEDQAQDNHGKQRQGNYEPQAAKKATAMNGIRSSGGRSGCHRSIFTGCERARE